MNNNNMPFVFFGSPDFAKIILEKLVGNGLIPSVVVCNPDKPFGRKQIITPPATKRLILDKKLPIKIFQPVTKEELLELRNQPEFRQARFGIIAAYAKIIPQQVIDSFPLGIIGVHPSLLPRHRGASPIQTIILEGDETTGVTLYLIDEKVDHGPIVASEKLKMKNEKCCYAELEKELAKLGGQMLLETIPKFVEGKITPQPQDDSRATYTKKFTGEDSFVDLEKDSPVFIGRKIRALNPDPGVYTFIGGKRVKLLEVSEEGENITITKTQPEGKRPQPAALKLTANR